MPARPLGARARGSPPPLGARARGAPARRSDASPAGASAGVVAQTPSRRRRPLGGGVVRVTSGFEGRGEKTPHPLRPSDRSVFPPLRRLSPGLAARRPLTTVRPTGRTANGLFGSAAAASESATSQRLSLPVAWSGRSRHPPSRCYAAATGSDEARHRGGRLVWPLRMCQVGPPAAGAILHAPSQHLGPRR